MLIRSLFPQSKTVIYDIVNKPLTFLALGRVSHQTAEALFLRWQSVEILIQSGIDKGTKDHSTECLQKSNRFHGNS